jgi:hypothetical protein
MSSTPSETTTSKALHDVKATPGCIRGWYYQDYDWVTDSPVRGPFTVGDMRDFLKEGTIDGNTLVRYFNSYWHPLREVSAIFKAPPRRVTSKRVRSGRPKYQEMLVLGALVIILELILIHWTIAA